MALINRTKMNKLAQALRVKIKALRAKGMLLQQIGEKFGITPQRVGQIIRSGR